MPVIPAPARVISRQGSFGLWPLVTVGYAQAGLATAAARFAAELARRTGLRARAVPGSDGDIVVALDDFPERAGLTAPLGLDPGTGDESHVITIGPDGIGVLAAAPPGAERAFATLLQLAATCDDATLPAQQIIDAPRLRWRGLSLDVVRRYFPPEAIRRVIDLLALYKLNVLHLHLTDDEGWRIEPGRPAAAREPDGSFYTNDELRDLVSYAAQRCVTIVPEIDTPGHVAALVKLRPELKTSRNLVRQAGASFRTAWLDPAQPATFGVIGEVFAELSSVIPGAFIHIGGDEAWQMPDNAYRAYLGRLLPMIGELGRRPIGWQEIIRADPGQAAAIQFWMSPASFEQLNTSELPPEHAALVTANGSRTRSDAARAVEKGVPVIMSPSAHCYLDVPYAEEPADPAKAAMRDRLGLRNYRAQTLRESFDWTPADELGGSDSDVGGVEAAIWCETVRDFDDLTFLLLPRLPGVAERAWSGGHGADWERHSAALGAHARLWAQDRLTYFRPAGPAGPHGGTMAH